MGTVNSYEEKVKSSNYEERPITSHDSFVSTTKSDNSSFVEYSKPTKVETFKEAPVTKTQSFVNVSNPTNTETFKEAPVTKTSTFVEYSKPVETLVNVDNNTLKTPSAPGPTIEYKNVTVDKPIEMVNVTDPNKTIKTPAAGPTQELKNVTVDKPIEFKNVTDPNKTVKTPAAGPTQELKNVTVDKPIEFKNVTYSDKTVKMAAAPGTAEAIKDVRSNDNSIEALANLKESATSAEGNVGKSVTINNIVKTGEVHMTDRDRREPISGVYIGDKNFKDEPVTKETLKNIFEEKTNPSISNLLKQVDGDNYEERNIQGGKLDRINGVFVGDKGKTIKELLEPKKNLDEVIASSIEDKPLPSDVLKKYEEAKKDTLVDGRIIKGEYHIEEKGPLSEEDQKKIQELLNKFKKDNGIEQHKDMSEPIESYVQEGTSQTPTYEESNYSQIDLDAIANSLTVTDELNDVKQFISNLDGLIKDLDKFGDDSTYVNGQFGRALSFASDVYKSEATVLDKYAKDNMIPAMKYVDTYVTFNERAKNIMRPIYDEFSLSCFNSSGNIELPDTIDKSGHSQTIYEAEALHRRSNDYKKYISQLSEESIR